LGIQFLWTKQVEEGLRGLKKNKLALQEVQERQNEVLMYLSQSTTQEIEKKIDRRNIETLVTIQVHQNDVLDYLAERANKRQIKVKIIFNNFFEKKIINSFYRSCKASKTIFVEDVSIALPY
jgi:uncharacterized protein (UPF0371 family)